jgi:double-stranded uracil-DNA glycosylase
VQSDGHPHQLRNAIEQLRPGVLAFNGKKAASIYVGRRTGLISYGKQDEQLGATMIYVMPSTSGAASGAWSITPWSNLARDLEASRAPS